MLTNCPTTYAPVTVLVNLLNTNDTIVVTTAPGDQCGARASPSPSTTAKIYIAQSQMLPLDPVAISESPAHAATNVPVAAPHRSGIQQADGHQLRSIGLLRDAGNRRDICPGPRCTTP